MENFQCHILYGVKQLYTFIVFIGFFFLIDFLSI